MGLFVIVKSCEDASLRVLRRKPYSTEIFFEFAISFSLFLVPLCGTRHNSKLDFSRKLEKFKKQYLLERSESPFLRNGIKVLKELTYYVST